LQRRGFLLGDKFLKVARMTKKEPVVKIKKLLKADEDLAFLLKLEVEDLQIPVARIKERVDLGLDHD
jgi:hypothetical protein